MSRNIAIDTLDEKIVTKIKRLERELQELKTNQLRVIVIPKVTADPTSLQNGQVWYRSDTNVFKVRENGVTKTITTV